MKFITFHIAVLGLLLGPGSNLVTLVPQSGIAGNRMNVNDLPAVDKPFKVAPYVHAAAVLQEMGKEKGCVQLARFARQGDDGQVAVLCRLLFSTKTKTPIRPPRLGKPTYLGGTGDDEWPLSPIELVGDVPFFIVQSYALGGEREPSSNYLAFCLENCEWSDIRFDKVSDDSIEKALQELLTSGKWKAPLTAPERMYLISQIK